MGTSDAKVQVTFVGKYFALDVSFLCSWPYFEDESGSAVRLNASFCLF